MGQAKAWSLFR